MGNACTKGQKPEQSVKQKGSITNKKGKEKHGKKSVRTKSDEKNEQSNVCTNENQSNVPNRNMNGPRMDSNEIDIKDDTMKTSQHKEEFVENKRVAKEDQNIVRTNPNQNKELTKNSNDSTSTENEADTMKTSQHKEEFVENKREAKEDQNIVRTNPNQNKEPKKNSNDSTSTENEADTMKTSQHREECVDNKSETKEDKNTVCTNANQNKEPKENSNDSSSSENEDDKMHNTQPREESVENKSEKKKEENNSSANENQRMASERNSTKDETATERTVTATGEWLSQEDILRANKDLSLPDAEQKLYRYAYKRIEKENEIDQLHDVRVMIVLDAKLKLTIEHGKPCSKLFIYLNKDGSYSYNWEIPRGSRTSIKNVFFASIRSAFTSIFLPTSSTSGTEQNEREKGIFEVMFESLKNFVCDYFLAFIKRYLPS